MTERVNLKLTTGTDAQVVATNAVAFLLKAGRIKNNGLYADVDLQVNGVAVSFQQVVVQLCEGLDQRVRERAINLLDADEGLSRLRKTLLQANLAVRAAVAELPVPKSERDDDEAMPV